MQNETIRAGLKTWKVSFISNAARFISDISARRWFPASLGLLAVLLMIPSIRHGFMLDDFLWRARLLEPLHLCRHLYGTGWVQPDSWEFTRVLWDLFAAFRSAEDTKALVDSGIAPWWTDRAARLAFFQPPTNLTYWFDYKLWPDSPALMHVHNILWFGAAITAVAYLYRRLSESPGVAGTAAFLYTIDESFYNPAAWISNRSILTSLFFGTLAILTHHHWRTRKSVPASVLSPILLLLCLLSKEFGVSVLAYYLAYACFMEQGGWSKRVLSLVPSVALVGIWKLFHAVSGYGVSNVGLYLDPLSEPSRVVAAIVERGPVLLLAQWSLVPAALYNFLTPFFQDALWWIAILYLGAVFLIMGPLLRGNRTALFWAVGMILSLVPATCTSVTEDRTLLFVGIGAMGLTAHFIARVLDGTGRPAHGRTWGVAAWSLCVLLIFTHVAGAGVGRVIRPYCVEGFKEYFFEPAIRIPVDPGLVNQDLIIVNAPSPLYFTYFPFVRAYRELPVPRVARVLAPAFGTMQLTRTGPNEIVLRARSDSMLSVENARQLPPADSIIRYMHDVYGYRRTIGLFRKDPCGMVPGDRTALPGLTVHVRKVSEDGCPSEVSFAFSVPLDDGSLRWLQWDWRTMTYLPFVPPDVGKSVVVRGVF
ncbi:MAG: hypothetical protein V1792_22630 [Pseudomonadota bacterium]